MDIKKVERISKALSDPSRIKILKEISKKRGCLYCTEIGDMIDLAQPSISHHLKQLVDADLVISYKEGRSVKFALNKNVLEEYTKFLSGLGI
jgi:ArsR family transcriptional regulator, arsenate/arsenite/antimonite-responsive transcriptional repressor